MHLYDFADRPDVELHFRSFHVRSQKIDIKLFKTGLIVEIVNLSEVARIIIVVLYLQVRGPIFIEALQHFDRIRREYMGVFGKLCLFELCVRINQNIATAATLASSDIILSRALVADLKSKTVAAGRKLVCIRILMTTTTLSAEVLDHISMIVDYTPEIVHKTTFRTEKNQRTSGLDSVQDWDPQALDFLVISVDRGRGEG